MPLELKAGTQVTLSQTIQGAVNDEAGVFNIATNYGAGTVVSIHKHRKGVLARTSIGNTSAEESSGDIYSFTLTLGDYKFLVADGFDPPGVQLVPHNDISRTANGAVEKTALEWKEKVFLLTTFTFISGQRGRKVTLHRGDCLFIWCVVPITAKTHREVKQTQLGEGHYNFRMAVPQTVPKLWKSNSYHGISAFTVATTT